MERATVVDTAFRERFAPHRGKIRRVKVYVYLCPDCGERRETTKAPMPFRCEACNARRNLAGGGMQTASRAALTKHGMFGTRIYRIWAGMIQRCSNPKNDKFKWYGARGISVCPEWREFQPFHDWAISSGYADGLTIDRVDNDGNYEPRNCAWATMKAQCANRRQRGTGGNSTAT